MATICRNQCRDEDMLPDDIGRQLQRKIAMLQNHLELRTLWLHLVDHGVITLDELNDMTVDGRRCEQILGLVDHLVRGTVGRYRGYLEALSDTHQEHVIEHLPSLPYYNPLVGHRPKDQEEAVRELQRQYEGNVMKTVKYDGHTRIVMIDVRSHYADLTIGRNVGGVHDTHPDSKLVELDEKNLFDRLEDEPAAPRSVLIEGAPGAGKTTLCRHLIYQWANPQLRQQIPFLKEIDMAILLECRSLTGQFMQDIRASLCPILRESSLEIINNYVNDKPSENSLLVLDGADECSQQVVEKVLCEAKKRGFYIIVSTRSNKANQLVAHFDRLLRLEGLRQGDALKLVQQLLIASGTPAEKAKLLRQHVDTNIELYTDILKNPQTCKLLALKLEESKGTPPTCTATELYYSLVEATLKRERRKFKETKTEELTRDTQSLNRMSLLAVLKQRTTFMLDELAIHHLQETSPVLGLLDKKCFITVDSEEFYWEASHLTWLEYLGAQAVMNIDDMRRRMQTLLVLLPNRTYDNLVKFVCGLVHKKDESLFLFLLRSILVINSSTLFDLKIDKSNPTCCSVHEKLRTNVLTPATSRDNVTEVVTGTEPLPHVDLQEAEKVIKAWYQHVSTCGCREMWIKAQHLDKAGAMQKVFSHVRDCIRQAPPQEYHHWMKETFFKIYPDQRAGTAIRLEDDSDNNKKLLRVDAHTLREAANVLATFSLPPNSELSRVMLTLPSSLAVRWWGEPPVPTDPERQEMADRLTDTVRSARRVDELRLVISLRDAVIPVSGDVRTVRLDLRRHSAVTAADSERLMKALVSMDVPMRGLVVDCPVTQSDALVQALAASLPALVAARTHLEEVKVWRLIVSNTGPVDDLLEAARGLGTPRRSCTAKTYHAMEVVPRPAHAMEVVTEEGRLLKFVLWDPLIGTDPGDTWWDNMTASGLVLY